MPARIQSIRPLAELTTLSVWYTADGAKELYAKKTGTLIRVLSKPNPKYAKKA